jgi:hypothetical protein
MLKQGFVVLGTLLAASTVALAQATTQPVFKKMPIQQTSAASGKDMYNALLRTMPRH